MQFYWLIKDFKNAHFYQEGSSYFKSILCLEKKWMRNNFQTQKFVKIMVFMSTIWMLNTYFFSSFFSIHILLQVALSTLSRTFLHQTHQFIRYIFFLTLTKVTVLLVVPPSQSTDGFLLWYTITILSFYLKPSLTLLPVLFKLLLHTQSQCFMF